MKFFNPKQGILCLALIYASIQSLCKKELPIFSTLIVVISKEIPFLMVMNFGYLVVEKLVIVNRIIAFG